MDRLCIYCNSSIGDTDDHVPPKCFYPKPRPSNLITVPACRPCNNEASFDEEYFLATFMFSAAGESEAGKKLWQGQIQRMYEKNKGIGRKMASLFREVRLLAPPLAQPKKGLLLEYNEERIKRACVKIIHGLYFAEHKIALPLDCDVQVELLSTTGKMDVAKEFNPLLNPGTWDWPGVFQYRHSAVSQSPMDSLWLLLLWNTHAFFGSTKGAA